MNKKFLVVLLSLLISLTATGCDTADTERNNTNAKTETESERVTLCENETRELLSQSFSPAAFFDHGEADADLTDEEIKSALSNIPTGQYEAYPDTHTVPVSATLYKDGKVVSIDPNDERLIRLTNFFNNCVYYSQCAYTQGLLPVDYIDNHVTGCDFRLELTYMPYGETPPAPYGTCTTICDTIVVTDEFTLMAHDLPGYEGEGERYPFRAVGYSPLYGTYHFLDLFGF